MGKNVISDKAGEIVFVLVFVPEFTRIKARLNNVMQQVIRYDVGRRPTETAIEPIAVGLDKWCQSTPTGMVGIFAVNATSCVA